MLNLKVNQRLSRRKITLTLVKTQQLPDTEKVDSKDEITCLKWARYNGRRKVCINFQTDTDKAAHCIGWNNCS